MLQRLLSRPKDFTWDELVTLLKKMGYSELSGAGSRKKFANEKKDIIHLHRPHPGKILKRYMIDIVIEHLKEKGKI
ncbi:MAG: type II toxin-antitoxin system HicA family toxin [Candidatus Margulisiibacteriota bacterium]